MKKILLLFILFTLSSCLDTIEETPITCEYTDPLKDLEWLKKIKTGFEQSASPSKKRITQYFYKNNVAFMINECVGCADNLVTVYNCYGKVICQFGGINGLNTCPDFEEDASNKLIIWEN
mgnify:CR=1 FL=1